MQVPLFRVSYFPFRPKRKHWIRQMFSVCLRGENLSYYTFCTPHSTVRDATKILDKSPENIFQYLKRHIKNKSKKHNCVIIKLYRQFDYCNFWPLIKELISSALYSYLAFVFNMNEGRIMTMQYSNNFKVKHKYQQLLFLNPIYMNMSATKCIAVYTLSDWNIMVSQQ